MNKIQEENPYFHVIFKEANMFKQLIKSLKNLLDTNKNMLRPQISFKTIITHEITIQYKNKHFILLSNNHHYLVQFFQ